MSGRQHQTSHQSSGQHRQHLHNPTGITDEVATEEHEFLEQAERSGLEGQETSTSQSTGQNKQKTGGLEGSSDTGSSMGQKAGSAMENIKNKAKESMNMK